jgi:IgA Peptidase M64/Peptidase M64 N-terminus
MITALLLALVPTAAQPSFDELFTGATLRFDYDHAGTAGEEHVCPGGVRLEGPWPGSRTRLVDDTNLGRYLFEVVDRRSNRVVYSRGFASIYGEWETTGEAKRGWRSFEESQRFPEPRMEVQLVLEKRGDDGAFHEIFSTALDPAGRFVDRSPITPRGDAFVLFETGPPAGKVDLLILSSGYPTALGLKFKADVDRLVRALFDTEPFSSHRSDFNVRALFVPSAEAGISNPRKGVWRDDPLGLSFNAFDSDRYVLTTANHELRELAAQVPYDGIVILFSDKKYGGGGIFNLWSTCAADSSEAEYLFVHEFGHSFAGLADEYYSSQVSYEDLQPPGVEPWEPNVTALLDPAALKWKDLVDPGTPLPSPWDQARYDKVDVEHQARRAALRARGAPEEEAEALFDEVRRETQPLLEAEPLFGKVGAFEGAMYQGKGLYRPEVDCIMFTRNPKSFCRVCRRAIERVIATYTQ